MPRPRPSNHATTDGRAAGANAVTWTRADGARHRPVTLQTIADRVGVSRSTVSNAYGHPDQLAASLRERILGIADELGYPGPHPVARTLRRGRVGAIGLLLTEALTYAFEDPAAVLFLQGVAETLESTDLGLLLLPAQPGIPFDPRRIGEAVVDGFLVYSVSDDHPAVSAIQRSRVPVVVIDEPNISDTGFVGVDDRGAAYTAAKHLTDLGHREFAVLSDRLSSTVPETSVQVSTRKESRFLVARSRLAGFQQALEEAGVAWEHVQIAECFPNQPETGRIGFQRLFQRHRHPTAILSITDQLALGALRGAADLGLRVPEDVSIVGFDDIPAAASSVPALTTVHQPLFGKGRMAAEMLVAADGESDLQRVQMATSLVVRGSTGRPNAPRR